MSGTNMDQLVEVFAKIRDARTVRRKAFEEEDAKLEAQQNMLRVYMLQLLNAMGGNSIATNHGTVYRTEKIKPSAADWGAIWTWVKDNDAFDLLERRLKSTFIKQFMDEHGGALPPGVNVHREFEVSVRRSGNQTGKQEESE